MSFKTYERSKIGYWKPEFDYSTESCLKEFIENNQRDSIDDFIIKRGMVNKLDLVRAHYGEVYDNFIIEERDKKIKKIINE